MDRSRLNSEKEIQFDDICRTCMSCSQENPDDRSFQLRSIFDYVDDSRHGEIRICDILNFAVHQLPKIHIMDEMPNNICTSCLDKLYACYEFQNNVKHCSKRLRALIQASRVQSSFMDVGKLQNDEDTIQTFIKQEIPFEAFEEDNLTQETTEMAEKNCSMENSFANFNKNLTARKTNEYKIEEKYKTVWKCKNCAQCFSNSDLLALHGENAKCQPCTGEKQLQYIQTIKGDILQMITVEVPKSSDVNGLDEDMETTTATEISNDDSNAQNFETWLCKRCEDIFFLKGCIKKHMQSVHNEKLTKHENYENVFRQRSDIHECDECNRVLLRLEILNRCSQTKMHEDVPRITVHEPGTSYSFSISCDKCDDVFDNLKMLEQHKLTHKGPFPFKCRLCHKSFKYNCHLLKHELTHSNEHLFYCARCRKPFGTLEALQEHAELHENEKRFECTFCTRKFRTYSGAYSHQRRIHKDMLA